MIRVGIGGWTFEPWRGVFYPEGLSQSKELGFASRSVTSIEVNGTFYSTFKPPTFRKWNAETPDDFVFSLKAPRYAVNRKELAGAGESIGKFFESGLEELEGKLGPILWQFAATKKFVPDDFEAFLDLLPPKLGSRRLRHALEVRHPTFVAPEFVALARKHKMAVVFADSPKYPTQADYTADFYYARLQNAQADVSTGYTPKELDRWAGHANSWAKGEAPSTLTYAAPRKADGATRDVFVYMINGAKERAPAAAMGLIERLND